jgi:hypothetical protein
MALGTSLVLIAIGAILYFAVTASVSGISIATIGLILMIVGAIGLLISLFYMGSVSRRRDETAPREPDDRL